MRPPLKLYRRSQCETAIAECRARRKAIELEVGDAHAIEHIEISLSCATTQDGRPAIEIGDDSIGLPERFDKARDGGAGFKIIRTLAENIGAELKVQSDDLGLSFRITLPRR